MIQLVILILIFVSHVKPNKRNENDFLRLPMVSRFISCNDIGKMIMSYLLLLIIYIEFEVLDNY